MYKLQLCNTASFCVVCGAPHSPINPREAPAFGALQTGASILFKVFKIRPGGGEGGEGGGDRFLLLSIMPAVPQDFPRGPKYKPTLWGID